mmetsp:Transcript_15732/g.27368  ORF Transcript_15732/g.27368 Transcript_15732/m.27368 type:complete len:136 (-) Transcript_15732:1459-1866(-)
MISLERSLDDALDQLKTRLQEVRPDSDLSEELADDLESIASTTFSAPHKNIRTVRFQGSSKEVEILQKRLSSMERENHVLRKEIEELKKLLGQKTAATTSLDSNFIQEEKKAEDKDSKTAILNEGGILKFILGAR